MSDFNNIATFRLADASKIDNLPANTNSELAGKAAASHTHDDIYYTETETNSLLNGKQSVSEKGQPSGYASLDGTGKVPASQLPATVVDGDMSKSTYDTNDNGIVDNSEKLGGQLPSYYLDVDNHTDGTTNKVYTTTEKTKLAGIEAGAEVNPLNTDELSEGLVNKYDKIVNILAGAGIGVTGTYPNFTVTNSSPDQIVSLTAGTNVTITGTYPNFTINATGGSGSGGGDMLKSVYDTDNNGIVDNSEALNGQAGSYYLNTDNHTDGTTNKVYTATEQTKLSGIEAGAEVNNISDINATDLTDGGDTTLHTHDGRYYTETETNNLLNAKANDNEVVKLTGNQTIAGVKTFSNNPVVSTGIEIGHASDTTITRVGAGRIAVEGIELVRNGDTPILTSLNISNADTTITRVSAGVIAVEGKTVATTDGTVNLTGNQTIAGVKTFSSSPIVPTPTADMEVATKKYVDDNAGGGSSTQSTFVAGENITAGNSLRNGSEFDEITAHQSGTSVSYTYVTIGYSTTYYKTGQSFTINNNGRLKSFSCYLSKSGSPTFTLQAFIYDNSNNLVGTSTNTIVSSTLSTSASYYNFLFSNLSLSPGVYKILLAPIDGSVSTTNYVQWQANLSGTYTGGVGLSATNTNIITEMTGSDKNFYFTFTNTTENFNYVYKTNASNSSKINFIGFATNTVSTGGTVTVDTCGINNNQSSLVIGSTYYLSDTDGAISTTPGTNITSVGKAISSTGIEINLDRVKQLGVITLTVGASPYTYQNITGRPLLASITGGTVSVVSYSRDGTDFYQTSGATNTHLVLGINDYVRITYSSAPVLRLFTF